MSVEERKKDIRNLIEKYGEVFLPNLDHIPYPKEERNWVNDMEWAKTELFRDAVIKKKFDGEDIYVEGPNFTDRSDVDDFEWPIRLTWYVHSNKDGNAETFRDLAHDGELPVEWVEKHLDDLIYLGYEIGIDVDFYKDGAYKIVGLSDS